MAAIELKLKTITFLPVKDIAHTQFDPAKPGGVSRQIPVIEAGGQLFPIIEGGCHYVPDLVLERSLDVIKDDKGNVTNVKERFFYKKLGKVINYCDDPECKTKRKIKTGEMPAYIPDESADN